MTSILTVFFATRPKFFSFKIINFIMNTNARQNNEVSWRGCSLAEIYNGLSEWEKKHVPSIYPNDSHTVLYEFPIKNTKEPPKPFKGHHKWDSIHVRLPCSALNEYPVTKNDGSRTIESRWCMIKNAFLKPINNSRELETAILSYNSKYAKSWDFGSLHQLFEEEFKEEESREFFNNLLPKIIQLALKMPELICTAIPLLRQNINRSISISQEQISCLIANAFLCTFPRRNTSKRKSEYDSYPDINFNRLFQSRGPQVIQKIKCICHYFKRVCDSPPIGIVTFTRRSMQESDLPKWDECNAPLGTTPLHITSAGTIEDQGDGLLQVDFANKFLGGGVLGAGCVQEEIRFVICPELIISKLFTEALKSYEAVTIIGCERYSSYTGYAHSFKWRGDFIDNTPFDENQRRHCNIVAIDALHFTQSFHQYKEELMLRELNKAYVGFFHPLKTPPPGVASGNWGCGAFGGEATLKALLQIMVCSATKRPLVYFTFGDCKLRDAIHEIYTFFIENNITVKELWLYLKEFRVHKLAPKNLFSFICQAYHDHQKEKKNNLNSREVNCYHISEDLQKNIRKSSEIGEKNLCGTKPSTSNSNQSNQLKYQSEISMITPIFKLEEEKLKNDENLEKITESGSKENNLEEKQQTELSSCSVLDLLDKYYLESPTKRLCKSD